MITVNNFEETVQKHIYEIGCSYLAIQMLIKASLDDIMENKKEDFHGRTAVITEIERKISLWQHMATQYETLLKQAMQFTNRGIR